MKTMRKVGVAILGITAAVAVTAAAGIPMLSWLRLFIPSFPGLIFYPLLAVVGFSTALSYMLPNGRVSQIFHIIGEAVTSIALIFLPLVLISDIIWLFYRGLPLLETGIAVIVLTGILSVAGIINAYRLRTVRYSVKFRLPCEELKIMLVSDLHLGFFTDRGCISRIADIAESEKPDLILIAGDIFDGNFKDLRHKAKISADLKRLREVCPVYGCRGNHDLIGDCKEARAFIENTGIEWIFDGCREFRGISFLFRRDIREHDRLGESEIMSLADKNQPVVVLDHNPSGIKELWQAGADLVLCGHTHGGQTLPLSLIYGLSGIVAYGMRSNGSSKAIVTSGAGIYGISVRLGVNSEVAMVEIKGIPKYSEACTTERRNI